MPSVCIAPSTTDYSTWSHSKTVTIDNTGSGSTLTDYAVRVEVTYEADMQADFGDVRFSEAVVSLAYWLESKVDSTSATFWVCVPIIPGGSTKEIMMHYGKLTAANASDGEATFALFDDFDVAPSTAWARHADNPILAGDEAFEGGFIRDAFVMRESATDWKMWYWGTDTNLGYATSTDGIGWTKIGQIEHTSGSALSGARPCVVKKGGLYWLFTNNFVPDGKIYASVSAVAAGPFSAPFLILEATEDWEDGDLYVPSVIWDDEDQNWKMWYSAANHTPSGETYTEPAKIGYATSSNHSANFGWVKHSGNPIVVPFEDFGWQSGAIQGWEVIKVDGVYHCIYTAADYWGTARVGYTTSTSPTSWPNISRQNLILDVGQEGEFDQDFVYGSNPVNVDGLLWTYYNGRHSADEAESLGIVMQTGAATVDALDTRKWWQSRGATVTVDNSNSIVTMDSGESSGYGHDNLIQSHLEFTNCMVEARVRLSSGFTAANTLSAIIARSNGVYRNPLLSSSADVAGITQYTHLLLDGSTTGDVSAINKWVNGAESSLETIAQTVARDTWYIQGFAAQGSSLRSFVDYTEVDSDTDSSIAVPGLVALRAYQSIVDCDWLRVRKYSYPEPTASVV